MRISELIKIRARHSEIFQPVTPTRFAASYIVEWGGVSYRSGCRYGDEPWIPGPAERDTTLAFLPLTLPKSPHRNK